METPKLKDIMASPVITIHEENKVTEAASAMSANNIGCLIVLNNREKPTGIVTERDMLRKIVVPCKDPRNTRIEQIMSSPLIVGDPKMDLMEAARFMIQKNVKRLPVLENGKLIGIVTLTDIIRSQPQTMDELGKLISLEKMPRRFRKWMKESRY